MSAIRQNRSGRRRPGANGLKDLWQHRRQFVANTRWWPPFCAVVDWIAAAMIAAAIAAGVRFHH